MSKKIILLAFFTGAAVLILSLFATSILKQKEEAALQQKKSIASLKVKQGKVEKIENDGDSGLAKNQEESKNRKQTLIKLIQAIGRFIGMRSMGFRLIIQAS